MGLDMYLRGEKYFWTNWEDKTKNLTEDGFKVKTKTLELGYWRKHPNLHGYIVNEFGGGNDDCQVIELSIENLKKTIQAIKDKSLPKTSGFFFGESDEADDAPSIEILEKAIAWAETKEPGALKTIQYQASW